MDITLSIDFVNPNEKDYTVFYVMDSETKEILLSIKLDKMPEQSEQDELKMMIKKSIHTNLSGFKRRLCASPIEQWINKWGM